MTGICGIDCSGSKTYLPMFVAACYCKDISKITDIYKKVTEIAIKDNPILAYRREVKAVNIKPKFTMSKIMDLISNFQVRLKI